MFLIHLILNKSVNLLIFTNSVKFSKKFRSYKILMYIYKLKNFLNKNVFVDFEILDNESSTVLCRGIQFS